MLFCAKKLVNLNKNKADYNYYLAMAFELNHTYDDAIKLYKKSASFINNDITYPLGYYIKCPSWHL